MVKLISAIIIFFTLCYHGESAKVLGIFPIPCRSHHILGHRLMEGLAKRGHYVVYVTPYREQIVLENYRQVILDGFHENFHDITKNFFKLLKPSNIRHTLFLQEWCNDLSRDFFEHPNVKHLIHSNETFDIVIAKQFFMDSVKGLAWHFNAHLILFSTLRANTWFNGLIGNPSPPSYIPELLTDFPSDMSFFQRLQNSGHRLFNEIILEMLVYPEQNKILHEYLPNAPDLTEIIYNTSLALVNADPSVNPPVPSVPNMIDIGGFHVKPSEKLPDDLQQFLDEATEGVVYFSMGSNLRSAMLPKPTREWLLKIFSKLKQKVLWKFEEHLDNRPSNVEIRKWFPQEDILGHPNVQLFISHGGLLSTIETVSKGVPVLAIPVFADQMLNAVRLSNRGLGRFIFYENLTESYFEETLHDLLDNIRYREEAEYMSRIMHDKPMKPLDTAIYWVEYVLRHNGAKHLGVSFLNLNIYQYLLLDVVAFFIISIFILLLVIKFLFKICSWKFIPSKCKKN